MWFCRNGTLFQSVITLCLWHLWDPSFLTDSLHLASSRGRTSMKDAARRCSSLAWSGRGTQQFLPHSNHWNTVIWPRLDLRGCELGQQLIRKRTAHLCHSFHSYTLSKWSFNWKSSNTNNGYLALMNPPMVSKTSLQQAKEQSAFTVPPGLERLLLNLDEPCTDAPKRQALFF